MGKKNEDAETNVDVMRTAQPATNLDHPSFCQQYLTTLDFIKIATLVHETSSKSDPLMQNMRNISFTLRKTVTGTQLAAILGSSFVFFVLYGTFLCPL